MSLWLELGESDKNSEERNRLRLIIGGTKQVRAEAMYVRRHSECQDVVTIERIDKTRIDEMIPKEVNISLWCSQMGQNGSVGTPGNHRMGRVPMDLQGLFG